MNRVQQEEWLLFFFGIALDCDSSILEALLLNGKSEILERKAIKSLINEFLKGGKFNTELPQKPIDANDLENNSKELFKMITRMTDPDTIYNGIFRLTRDTIVWIIVNIDIGYEKAYLCIISRVQPGVFLIQAIYLRLRLGTLYRLTTRIALIFGGRSFTNGLGSHACLGSNGEFKQLNQFITEREDALSQLSKYIYPNGNYLFPFQKEIDLNFRDAFLIEKEVLLVKLLHSLDK